MLYGLGCCDKRPENSVVLSRDHTGEEAALCRHVGHGAQVEDFTSGRVIKKLEEEPARIHPEYF